MILARVVLLLALFASSHALAGICDGPDRGKTLASRSQCALDVKKRIQEVLRNIENVPPEAAEYNEREYQDLQDTSDFGQRLVRLTEYRYWYPFQIRNDAGEIFRYLDRAVAAATTSEQAIELAYLFYKIPDMQRKIRDYVESNDTVARRPDGALNKSVHFELLTVIPIVVSDLFYALKGAIEQLRDPAAEINR